MIPALETPYSIHAQPVCPLALPGPGCLLGLASVAYIRSLYAFEDSSTAGTAAATTSGTSLGMFVVGIIMYVLLIDNGHY